MFHIRASYRLQSLSFHVNRASHSGDTIWPSQFQFQIHKVKCQVQRYPSQRSVQPTHFLNVSHQGILPTPVPFVPWQSGLPFPSYNLTLKIQGQRSRSKVKAKGTLVSVASNWFIFFCFTSIGPTIPEIWQIECLTGETRIWSYTRKLNFPKFNQVVSFTRGISLPSFVAIACVFLTLSWGQAKFRPASVA